MIDFLHIGVFAVQYAQRILVEAANTILIQAIFHCQEIIDQRVPVGMPRFRRSQRVDFQLQSGQTEPLPHACAHYNQFRIDVRPLVSERLDVELVKLAISPLLRFLVTEHRPGGPQFLALIVQQSIRDARPHHAGSRLGAQCQAHLVPILEGVHLLLDDVRHFANRAAEQLGMLQDRQSYFPITVGFDDITDNGLQVTPDRHRVRQDVVHSAYRFWFHVRFALSTGR
jgi:hypothetical protein